MTKLIKQKNKGFVLLFSVIVLTVLLTVSLSVSFNSLQELAFATSATGSNDAFYAANIGAECALFNDKSTSLSFLEVGSSGEVECLGTDISFTAVNGPAWSFVLTGLGPKAAACAQVTVTKDFNVNPVTTVVDSKGFNFGDNSCNSSAPFRIERSIQVTY